MAIINDLVWNVSPHSKMVDLTKLFFSDVLVGNIGKKKIRFGFGIVEVASD